MLKRRRSVILPALALLVLIAGLLTAGPASATLTNQFFGTLDSSGSTAPKFKNNPVNVQGPGTLSATLSWDNSGAKLTLFLKDPTGLQVATQTAGTNPETLSFNATSIGTWVVGVKDVSGGVASYTLTVTHSPGVNPPPALATYSASFGYTGHAGLYGYGMAFDATDGTLLVGDLWNYRVQRWTTGGTPIGTVSQIAPRGATGGIGSPFGLAADNLGNVWVADQSNSRVVEFDHSGKWLQTIGSGGGPNPGENYAIGCGGGKTTIPTNIAVDPTNNDLYVSDPRCGNVYVFNSSGTYLRQFTWPTGIHPIPRGVAIDNTTGNVFVAEFNTKSVYIFNKAAGTELGVFTNPAQTTDMSDPRGLAIDQTNHLVYVVGAQNNKVVQFLASTTGPSGAWRATFGADTTGACATPPSPTARCFNSIRYVATDSAGAVYVSDVYGYRVWKLDSSGNVLPWATGAQPPPNGGMNQNNGIGIDPATGNLYVVDTFENRVQRFATTTNGQPTGPTNHCVSVGDCPAWQIQFGHRGPLALDSADLDYPHEVTFGGGFVWMDAPNAVLQLDVNGNLVNRWGTHGKGVGQFSNGPQGIRVLPDALNPAAANLVYTTDVGNCRLSIWDYAGNLKSSMGTCGKGTDQMTAPRQLDVVGNLVYVADTGNSRVVVWDTTTNHIVKIINSGFNSGGGPSLLNQPTGVLMDPTGTWLYIGDTNNKRIVRVHPDGSSPTLVTSGGDTPQGTFGGPQWMEWGPDGRLYTSDNNHTVYAFTITG